MRFALIAVALATVRAAQPAAPGRAPQAPAPRPTASAAALGNAPRSIGPYLRPATSRPKPPDADGFLQRWLLREPINKPNRTNTVFIDSYVRSAFNTGYFPNQFTVARHEHAW